MNPAAAILRRAQDSMRLADCVHGADGSHHRATVDPTRVWVLEWVAQPKREGRL